LSCFEGDVERSDESSELGAEEVSGVESDSGDATAALEGGLEDTADLWRAEPI
jgi:hypothetical protein